MRYEEAGVHIEAKAEALRRAREAIAATYTPEVLRGMGAFGGLYAASRLKALEEPVLVATTDGVGTKTLLALEAGDVSGLGFDLVNHSVNDLLAQGAEPLFFLDYLAASHLDEGVLAALLASLAEACRAHSVDYSLVRRRYLTLCSVLHGLVEDVVGIEVDCHHYVPVSPLGRVGKE